MIFLYFNQLGRKIFYILKPMSYHDNKTFFTLFFYSSSSGVSSISIGISLPMFSRQINSPSIVHLLFVWFTVIFPLSVFRYLKNGFVYKKENDSVTQYSSDDIDLLDNFVLKYGNLSPPTYSFVLFQDHFDSFSFLESPYEF